MIILKNVEKKYNEDSSQSIHPGITAEIATKKLRYFRKGAFYGLQEVGNLDSLGLYVYRVACDNPLNEWGKGISKEQCRASAVMERVERLSSLPNLRTDVNTIRSTYNDLNEKSVSRKDFGLINLHYILYGEDKIDNLEMGWVKTQSLISNKTKPNKSHLFLIFPYLISS